VIVGYFWREAPKIPNNHNKTTTRLSNYTKSRS
jgi:hypothetical protein